jgi:hypothetical protein
MNLIKGLKVALLPSLLYDYCHIFRYFLGSMHESLEFQILSGIKIEDRNIFWTIYVAVTVTILTVALGSMTVKKMIEKFKEYRIQKTVHVNIQKQNPQISIFNFVADNSNEAQPFSDQLNNKKHNVPILNSFEMAVFGYVSVARILAFLIAYLIYGENTEFILHQIYILRKLSFAFLLSIILPMMYLYKRKDFRLFISSRIIPKLYCYIRIKKSTKPKQPQAVQTDE